MSMANLFRGGILLALVAGMIALASPAIAQTGVTNSVHDLNAYSTSPITMPDGRICVACHTPHNAKAAVTDAPLWNHEASLGGHTPYPSGPGTSMNAVVGAPAGISLLCLSCHDGSIALDSFGVGTRSPGAAAVTLTGTALFSTDLSNDHPVSFTYDDVLATADGELEDPTTALSDLGSTIAADMLFGAGNDQLECASCHDVHNGPGVPAGSALLRKDNTASALCTTCHQK
jgi:predicted CXXCH cytochrome family protein